MIEGLVTFASPFGPDETFVRLLAALSRRGLRLFATIDHGQAAREAGLAMRPAKVAIFGNPRAGTPLMRLAPTLAIDLPLKALVWEDEAGATWLSHDAPAWLARRHALGAEAAPLLQGMAGALAEIARDVVRPVA